MEIWVNFPRTGKMWHFFYFFFGTSNGSSSGSTWARTKTKTFLESNRQNSWEKLKKSNRLVTAELQKKKHILTIFPVLGKLTHMHYNDQAISWSSNAFDQVTRKEIDRDKGGWYEKKNQGHGRDHVWTRNRPASKSLIIYRKKSLKKWTFWRRKKQIR